MDSRTRHLEIDESARVPKESLVFGWLAMVPLFAGAAFGFLPGPAGAIIAHMAALWAAAILAFLAGVRRGVSFRTPGGATGGQLAVMLGHFGVAYGGLLVLGFGLSAGSLPAPGLAALVLLPGYASLGVLDPSGAEEGTMPKHFAALRPWQMAAACVALIVLVAASLTVR